MGKKAQVRINLVTVPAAQIHPNPWNPNEQTDFIFDKERQSIRTHGFIDPILVREKGAEFEIIDGEHRWRAAQAEGITEIPCNNLGPVTDRVAKQLTIIMNETRGQARRDKLAELLKDLSQGGVEDLYENLPYQQIEIDSLVNQMQVDWSQIEGPKSNEGSDGSKSKPTVEHESDFRDVKFRLPEGVAEMFEEQITRMKRAIHPDEDPGDVSPVLAIEAITQHIAQIPDDQLVG